MPGRPRVSLRKRAADTEAEVDSRPRSRPVETPLFRAPVGRKDAWMTTTRITYLCESCAEGWGLEVDGARLQMAVCEVCRVKTMCLVTLRPSEKDEWIWIERQPPQSTGGRRQ